MRYALMTEPQQGLRYEELLALAQAAERAGLEGFFRSDHYTSFPGSSDRPTSDAWTTLAGLARETARIRLGVLVSPVTFRLPGQLAMVVTTVDEMSGGRVEVGVGAGWNELEHARLGLPFPKLEERLEMLTEELQILRGLWSGEDGWSFEGRYWRVRDARFRSQLTRPGRAHRPHLILGGQGRRRSVELAARWADEYNIPSISPAKARAASARLDAACLEVGRDPRQIVRSGMTGVLIAETPGELDDRIHDLLEMVGGEEHHAQNWFEERRDRWIIGTPDQAREQVEELERAGVERLMLQDFLPRDLEMVELIGAVFAR